MASVSSMVEGLTECEALRAHLNACDRLRLADERSLLLRVDIARTELASKLARSVRCAASDA